MMRANASSKAFTIPWKRRSQRAVELSTNRLKGLTCPEYRRKLYMSDIQASATILLFWCLMARTNVPSFPLGTMQRSVVERYARRRRRENKSPPATWHHDPPGRPAADRAGLTLCSWFVPISASCGASQCPMDVFVLSDKRLGSIAEWQQAIDAAGFALTLMDDGPFDAFARPP